MNDKAIEGEIVEETEINTLATIDNSPERINSSLVIANMEAQIEIKKAFMQYVSKSFRAGVDFYKVTENVKAALGQPGAQ